LLRFRSLTLLLPLYSFQLTASELFPYVSLTTDTSKALHGASDDQFVTRALLDFGAEYALDVQHFLFANIQVQRGQDGSIYSQDIQAYSNIDADDFGQLSEFWYQYSSDIWRMKIGQIDGNSEFAVAESAGEFINSSMGLSPTIFVMPTYPQPVLAAMSFWQVGKNLVLSTSVSAGQGKSNFSSQLYLSQLSFSVDDTTLAAGYWFHNGEFDTLNEQGKQAATQGYYATLDTTLLGPSAVAQRLGFFMQFGRADQDVAEIKQHVGFGWVLEAPFDQEQHILGFGLSKVWLSEFLPTPNNSETAIELFYRWSINDYLSVKPDLQWIINPSGADSEQNAVVATLRFEFNY
jgi:porin